MNKKMIYYGILLGVLVIVAGFGLYNLISATTYKNNELSFVVNDDDAFFRATGNYYYGETNEPTSTYVGAEYSQEDYYKGNIPTFSVWSLGTSEFIIDTNNHENDITVLKYVVTIQNLNLDKTLNIDVKGVAVHPNTHFITDIHYKTSMFDGLIFSNNEDAPVNKDLYYNLDKTSDSDDRYVNIVNHQLVSGDTLEIVITLSLNTKTKEFTLDNNITFELTTVDNA